MKQQPGGVLAGRPQQGSGAAGGRPGCCPGQGIPVGVLLRDANGQALRPSARCSARGWAPTVPPLHLGPRQASGLRTGPHWLWDERCGPVPLPGGGLEGWEEFSESPAWLSLPLVIKGRWGGSLSVLGSGCCPHIVLCPGRCGQGPGRTPVPVREGDEERAAGHTALLPPPAQLQPVGKGQGWRGQDTPGAPLGLRPPAPPQPRGGGRASWAVAELLCPTGHEQVLGSLRERPGLLRVGCVCGSVRDVPPCVSLG